VLLADVMNLIHNDEINQGEGTRGDLELVERVEEICRCEEEHVILAQKLLPAFGFASIVEAPKAHHSRTLARSPPSGGILQRMQGKGLACNLHRPHLLNAEGHSLAEEDALACRFLLPHLVEHHGSDSSLATPCGRHQERTLGLLRHTSSPLLLVASRLPVLVRVAFANVFEAMKKIIVLILGHVDELPAARAIRYSHFYTTNRQLCTVPCLGDSPLANNFFDLFERTRVVLSKLVIQFSRDDGDCPILC